MMKKTIMAVSMIAALAAVAEREDIAEIRLAPAQKTTTAIVKAAELTGNGAFGAMSAVAFASSGATNCCGNGRMVLSADSEKTGDIEKYLDSSSTRYETASGELPEDVIAQIKIFRPLVKRMSGAISEAADGIKAKGKAGKLKEAAALLEEIQEILVCAKIADSGIELTAKWAFARGSKTISLCKTAIDDAAPLAFAKGSPLAACACVQPCGEATCVETVNRVLAILKNKGIEIKGVRAAQDPAGFDRIEFDFDALIAYAFAEAEKQFDKVSEEDGEKLCEELEAAFDGEAVCKCAGECKCGTGCKCGTVCKCAGECKCGTGCKCGSDCKCPGKVPVARTALYVDGVALSEDAQAAFARLMPEAAAVKCLGAGVAHHYAIFRTLLDAMLRCPESDKDIVAMFKNIAPLLPAADKAGIGYMIWRDGDDINARVRISPNEIRGFGTTVSAIIGLFGAAAADEADEEELLDDDGDDD